MNLMKMSTPLGIKAELKGWAQNYLDKMLNGLTGNLHNLFYPFNTDCWLKHSFQDGGLEGWWPYEQVAYWLDGYVKCAYFANNSGHFAKAKEMIDSALQVTDSTGFIGANELKERGQGNQWVHAVMLRAVLFLYEITEDGYYLEKVKNHYLSGTNDYSEWRESVNIENIIMCYLYCKDERLKELALSAYNAHSKNEKNIETKFDDFLKDTPIKLHAVTYDEMVKIPALLYAVTGEKSYLDASIKGIARIEKNHMLPIGIHSGSEAFGDTDALAGIETCDITDFCWSLGYLAQITGQSRYLDMIERIMYNIAPSVMDKDFKTLQYFSSANQVISSHNSNHTQSFTQTPRMAYQSDHYPECCTGNANRSMPNFIYRALMKNEGGYCFNFYIPGNYRADGILFEVNTEYPYKEKVEIVYKGADKKLCLKLRIPSWCDNFEYKCRQETKSEDNWLYVKGEFKNNDSVILKLNSNLETASTKEGLLVKKEPLIYTLDIKPKIQIDKTETRQTKEFPAYNVFPDSEWQIALDKQLFEDTAVLNGDGAKSLLENSYEITAEGYFMHGVGLKKIHSSKVPVSAYDKVELVKLRAMGQVIYDGEMQFTPAIKDIKPTSLKRVKIKLVPYSTAMLRWTIFPDAKKLN